MGEPETEIKKIRSEELPDSNTVPGAEGQTPKVGQSESSTFGLPNQRNDPTSPSHSTNDARTIGPYHLQEQIGQGGMGAVWRAIQFEPIQRTVAIKLIRVGDVSGEVLARFSLERQALALMEHRNVARLIDAGATETGTPFFVMELVEGKAISSFCDEQKLDIRTRLKLFLQVCAGVQHAHQKGLIHRDLKPGNILVGIEDGKPVPKVIDFGLAKATEHLRRNFANNETVIGQVLGTPRYMSPEQAMASADIDTRTDVYALGVLLYELLVGCSPLDEKEFKNMPIFSILEYIQKHEPVRPSRRLVELGALAADNCSLRGTDESHLVRLLRGDLDWVVMKALSKEREDRYPSVTALAADIERYLLGETISARPPSAMYRFKKFVARNQAMVAMTIAMIGLMVTATTLSARFALTANQALKNESLALTNERQAKQDAVDELTRSRQQRLIAASQRGQWQEVLELSSTQLASPTRDEGWWRLQRIHAFHEMLKYKEAQGEIDSALSSDENEPYRGQLLLWQAELKLLSNSQQARDLYRKALEKGLPKADEYYARAMIDSTQTSALEFARDAVEEYPFDSRFHKQLILGEFLLGHHSEVQSLCKNARRLFPDDPTIRTIEALSQGLSGSETEMQRLLSDDQRLSPASRELVIALCRDSRSIGRFLVNFDSVELPLAVQARLTQAAFLLPQENWFSEMTARAPHGTLDEVKDVIFEIFKVAAFGSAKAKRRVADQAAKLAAVNSNGLLHLMAGYLYFSFGAEVEAIAELRNASETNWVIPYSQNDALFLACYIAVARALREPTETHQAEVREMVNALYKKGVPEHRTLLVVGIAAKYGEPEMALTLLDRMPKNEQNTLAWLQPARKAAKAAGSLSRVQKHCDEILAIDPVNQAAKETILWLDEELERLIRSREKVR